jgi:ABC-type lipoprotein release transport system permease subunit
MAWRNLWRRPVRTGLTVAATVFAVSLNLVMLSMAAGSHERWIEYVVSLYPGHIEVSLEGYRENRTLEYLMRLEAGEVSALDRLTTQRGWAPRLETWALAIPDREGSLGRAALLVGIDPARERELSRLAKTVREGRFLAGPDGANEIVVGEALARNLDVAVGEQLILLSSDYYGSQAADRFRLVGTLATGQRELDGHLVLVSLDRLQDFIEYAGGVSHVALFVPESDRVEPLQASLEAIFTRDRYEVLAWHQLLPDLTQMLLLDDIGAWLMLAILVVVVAFGLLNTVLMSVMERVREFGMMRAVGTRPGMIFRLVMLESTLLGVLGIAVGLAISIPVLLWLEGHAIPIGGSMSEMAEVFEIEPVIAFHLRRVDVIGAPLAIFLVALLAAVPAAVRGSRGRPVDALRDA